MKRASVELPLVRESETPPPPFAFAKIGTPASTWTWALTARVPELVWVSLSATLIPISFRRAR